MHCFGAKRGKENVNDWQKIRKTKDSCRVQQNGLWLWQPHKSVIRTKIHHTVIVVLARELIHSNIAGMTKKPENMIARMRSTKVIVEGNKVTINTVLVIEEIGMRKARQKKCTNVRLTIKVQPGNGIISVVKMFAPPSIPNVKNGRKTHQNGQTVENQRKSMSVEVKLIIRRMQPVEATLIGRNHLIRMLRALFRNPLVALEAGGVAGAEEVAALIIIAIFVGRIITQKYWKNAVKSIDVTSIHREQAVRHCNKLFFILDLLPIQIINFHNLASKPATTTRPTDSQSTTSGEKTGEDASKSLNIDENADEEIADDLSEISDEADDILGQQEVKDVFIPQSTYCLNNKHITLNLFKSKESKSQPTEHAVEKSMTEESKDNSNQVVKDSNDADTDKSIEQNDNTQGPEHLTPAKSPEEADRSKDLIDDIDLDFEEISDGELEEEARTKGPGDALGVDWAGLVEESKAMMRERLTKSETSARQRWNPDQILLDVGISYKMAGNAFAQQTLLTAFENMKHELKNGIVVKSEPLDDSNHMDVDIKIENDVEIEMKDAKLNGKCERKEDEIDDRKLILHPLPCVQTSIKNAAEKQRQLIFNASGPYSRGLCTRRDIGMRRQLCDLAINESNCKAVNTRTGYENIALKLFQKALQA